MPSKFWTEQEKQREGRRKKENKRKGKEGRGKGTERKEIKGKWIHVCHLFVFLIAVWFILYLYNLFLLRILIVYVGFIFISIPCFYLTFPNESRFYKDCWVSRSFGK